MCAGPHCGTLSSERNGPTSRPCSCTRAGLSSRLGVPIAPVAWIARCGWTEELVEPRPHRIHLWRKLLGGVVAQSRGSAVLAQSEVQGRIGFMEADGHRVRQGREVHRGEAREQIVGLGAGECVIATRNTGGWPRIRRGTDEAWHVVPCGGKAGPVHDQGRPGAGSTARRLPGENGGGIAAATEHVRDAPRARSWPPRPRWPRAWPRRASARRALAGHFDDLSLAPRPASPTPARRAQPPDSADPCTSILASTVDRSTDSSTSHPRSISLSGISIPGRVSR